MGTAFVDSSIGRGGSLPLSAGIATSLGNTQAALCGKKGGRGGRGGGMPTTSAIGCRVRSMPSLLRSGSHIPHWLPTALRPIGPGPTPSLRLGGCPGSVGVPVCCYLGGPVLLPTLPTLLPTRAPTTQRAIHIIQRPRSAERTGVTVQSMRILPPDPYSRSGLPVSPPFRPRGYWGALVGCVSSALCWHRRS